MIGRRQSMGGCGSSTRWSDEPVTDSLQRSRSDPLARDLRQRDFIGLNPLNIIFKLSARWCSAPPRPQLQLSELRRRRAELDASSPSRAR